MDRFTNTTLLHPEFRGNCEKLGEHLIRSYQAGSTKTLFKVFETFRSPERQLNLLMKGVTKAGPWQSAHQFGLACDFVPFVSHDDGSGEFSWASTHDYAFLKASAEAFELRAPISWDKCHVQHRGWENLRIYMKNRL